MEGYRKYTPEVPHFLHNRPRNFLDHCIKRLPPQVDIITESNICHDSNSEGIFNVTSPESGQEYMVILNGSMPTCSCPDFQSTHWPCKHMLAIFSLYPAFGWDFLSPDYTGNVYFKIDSEFITKNFNGSWFPVCTEESNQTVDTVTDSVTKQDIVQQEHVSEVKARQKCLDVLKTIQNGIYNATKETLLQVLSHLEVVEKLVESKHECIKGLPLRRSRKRKRKYTNPPLLSKKSALSNVEIDGTFEIFPDTQQSANDIPCFTDNYPAESSDGISEDNHFQDKDKLSFFNLES